MSQQSASHLPLLCLNPTPPPPTSRPAAPRFRSTWCASLGSSPAALSMRARCRWTSGVLEFLIQGCRPRKHHAQGEALPWVPMGIWPWGGGQELGHGLVQAWSFLPTHCTSCPERASLGVQGLVDGPCPASPVTHPDRALVHPQRTAGNCFVRLKQTSVKEEKPNLNGRPPGCLWRQMGEDLTRSPRSGLCADLRDRATLPGNGASPPGGLIRAWRSCVFGKCDFVSGAEGVLTLLLNAPGPAVR